MEINKLTQDLIPTSLRTIPSAPKLLYATYCIRQLESLLKRKSIAIVGSRKITAYGRQVTYDLAYALAAQGVVVISGLALGVDAVAHRAALDVGSITIAVLPGSVEKVYPRSHQRLVDEIVAQDGALISEYAADTVGFPSNFVAHNRIVSGLADALLITEAAHQSGTMHIVTFASEQGKDVLAVPGNITSETSAGTNQLIKDGATPITLVDDVLHVLGIAAHGPVKQIKAQNPQEQAILELLLACTADADTLHVASHLSTAVCNQTLTMLEIRGQIRSLGAIKWRMA